MTDRGIEPEALPSTSDILNNMSNRLASPPGSRTPPSGPIKNTLSLPDTSGNHSYLSNHSDAVDPAALANALRDFDEAGRRRERTPGASPSRKRQRVYGDR
jgi:cell division cycle 20-like protein 1 (cofactor of APC complex)